MTSPRLLTHHDDGEKSAVIWREEDDAARSPPLDYCHNGSFRGLGEGGAVFPERAAACAGLAEGI
jgi:hypothetical protein